MPWQAQKGEGKVGGRKARKRDVYAWFTLTSYHPLPRAYPRGFANFFFLGGLLPHPRALRKSRYFCVSFLWSRNAKFKNIPKQAHLPKAIKIQPVSNILQKKMEPKRCYACADLLFIASLHERRAYERERCWIFLHHNCVDLQHLKSKCVSCDERRNGFLLKTLAVPDLVSSATQPFLGSSRNAPPHKWQERCVTTLKTAVWQTRFSRDWRTVQWSGTKLWASATKRVMRNLHGFGDKIAQTVNRPVSAVCPNEPLVSDQRL